MPRLAESAYSSSRTESNPPGLNDHTSSSVIMHSSEGLVFSRREKKKKETSEAERTGSLLRSILTYFFCLHRGCPILRCDMKVVIRGNWEEEVGGLQEHGSAASCLPINDT